MEVVQIFEHCSPWMSAISTRLFSITFSPRWKSCPGFYSMCSSASSAWSASKTLCSLSDASRFGLCNFETWVVHRLLTPAWQRETTAIAYRLRYVVPESSMLASQKTHLCFSHIWRTNWWVEFKVFNLWASLWVCKLLIYSAAHSKRAPVLFPLKHCGWSTF